jgi:hypothetical protein
MPPNPPNEPTSLDAVKVLAKHCGDRRSEKVRDQPSTRRLKYGETRAYTLARLRRDRPDQAGDGGGPNRGQIPYRPFPYRPQFR